MKKTILSFLCMSSISQASIYCEIYDLATADILGVAESSATVSDIQKKNLQLDIHHDLIHSDFFLSWNTKTQTIDLKIISTEVANQTTSFHQWPDSAFLKKFKMGFNEIELTGLGDNVHSRCEWTP